MVYIQYAYSVTMRLQRYNALTALQIVYTFKANMLKLIKYLSLILCDYVIIGYVFS